VIVDTLGVDRKDMADFKHWSDAMLAGNLDPLDNEGRAKVARAVIDFQNYFIPRIEERRKDPRNDLLSDLANAEIEDDDVEGAVVGPRKLTDAELLPIMSQILLAGNETTTNLIGNGLVLLLEHPEAMAEVRADYGLIPAFIEEALRYEPPAACTYRLVKTDAEVAGEKIPEGSMVVTMWGAANQDPEVFPEPRKFDIHRANAKRHLSFGTGVHFCVGSEMARVEAKVAFETLFNRLADIRLVSGTELNIFPTFTTRGFESIPIEFDRASS
jgi:cytochrome P450